ncbi:MAG TPA: hypothetical protein VFM18_08990, partial [Methanosarcina sp.]|nr:hypothetical protein [Methanosarcina sp.]
MKYLFFILLSSSSLATLAETESTCFGTPDNGKLSNGWQLPSSGKNFEAYSSIGVAAGRNYVHSSVYK